MVIETLRGRAGQGETCNLRRTSDSRVARRANSLADPRCSRVGSAIAKFADTRTGEALTERPEPQCAFKMSMFSVYCNSHEFTQLAALFIDARAE